MSTLCTTNHCNNHTSSHDLKRNGEPYRTCQRCRGKGRMKAMRRREERRAWWIERMEGGSRVDHDGDGDRDREDAKSDDYEDVISDYDGNPKSDGNPDGDGNHIDIDIARDRTGLRSSDRPLTLFEKLGLSVDEKRAGPSNVNSRRGHIKGHHSDIKLQDACEVDSDDADDAHDNDDGGMRRNHKLDGKIADLEKKHRFLQYMIETVIELNTIEAVRFGSNFAVLMYTLTGTPRPGQARLKVLGAFQARQRQRTNGINGSKRQRQAHELENGGNGRKRWRLA